MDYPTLVLYLENHLNWIRRQGSNHLNIQQMPQVELCKLLEGLYQVVEADKDEQGKVIPSSSVTVLDGFSGESPNKSLEEHIESLKKQISDLLINFFVS